MWKINHLLYNISEYKKVDPKKIFSKLLIITKIIKKQKQNKKSSSSTFKSAMISLICIAMPVSICKIEEKMYEYILKSVEIK